MAKPRLKKEFKDIIDDEVNYKLEVFLNSMATYSERQASGFGISAQRLYGVAMKHARYVFPKIAR